MASVGLFGVRRYGVLICFGAYPLVSKVACLVCLEVASRCLCGVAAWGVFLEGRMLFAQRFCFSWCVFGVCFPVGYAWCSLQVVAFPSADWNPSFYYYGMFPKTACCYLYGLPYLRTSLYRFRMRKFPLLLTPISGICCGIQERSPERVFLLCSQKSDSPSVHSQYGWLWYMQWWTTH
ncbi:hypothetical protein U1Q18_037353 [Sarracenia purpurea var. burkii]